MTFTVSDFEPRHQYIASPAQVDFTLQFEWRADADIAVYVDDALKTLGVHYNLTGAQTSGGGICTFVTPMLGGEIVVIYGNMPISRDDALYATGGQLPGHVIEGDQNNQTMRMKQLERDLNRSVHMAPGDTTDPGDFELPPAEQRADKLLGFDSNGKPELVTPIDDVGMLSVSVVGGVLYPQTLHEVAAAATPVNIQDNYGVYTRYGATGDGVTIDNSGVAAAIRVAEGSQRSVSGVAGDTYKLDAVLVPTGQLLMTMFGATFKGDGTDDFLQPKTRFDLFDGTFDTHKRGINNENAADPALDLSVVGTEFKNGLNIPINIECPSRYFSVIACRFFNGIGYQIRLGKNDVALQPGWVGSLVAFNYFENLTAAGASGMSASISYADQARVIGNQINGVAGTNGEDVSYFYIKSRGALVVANVARGIHSISGSAIVNSINLKGDTRSGLNGTPVGFGATAALNSFRSGVPNIGSGTQMESDEQAVFCSYFDDYQIGVLGGSGDFSYSVAALNRGHNFSGASDSRGLLWGSIQGEFALSAGNIWRGYRNGEAVTVQTTDTLQNLSIISPMLKGQGPGAGAGVSIVGVDADSITDVIVAFPQVASFNQQLELTKVRGGYVVFPRFRDINTPSRPVYLSSCKNLRGVGIFNRELQTTDATNTTVFQIGDMADGNVLHVTHNALAARSDMSAVAKLRREYLFKMTAGVATLVNSSTLINEGGSALPADALSAAVTSTVRGIFSCKGIAAQTWNWTHNFDFELL